MPLSTVERARRAGRARWDKTTDPAERSAQTQPARIAAAVKAVCDAAPVLSDDQRSKLRAILTVPEGGDGHGG